MDEEAIDHEVALAFAPLHKRALGIAVGLTLGVTLFVTTGLAVLISGDEPTKIGLLAEYFYGYEVSWPGALIGLAWGVFVGFVIGWFAAFMRNLVMAVSVFITRTKAELIATRDFLDHI